MSLGGGRLFEGWLRCNHSPGLLLRLIAKPSNTPDNALASFNSNGACNCQSEREAVDAEYTTRHPSPAYGQAPMYLGTFGQRAFQWF